MLKKHTFKMIYYNCAVEALIKYKILEKRTNHCLEKEYRQDIFTSLHHKIRFSQNYSADSLLNRLNSLKNENKAKNVILKYLYKHSTSYNHSFRSYLIESLVKPYPNDGWELFENEPISYFCNKTIPLYRGVKLLPNTVFHSGLKSHSQSHYVSAYTSSQNGRVGNSTTKNYNVALNYAAPRSDPDPALRQAQLHCKKLYGTSYIYIIHYRGNKGIDIPLTHKLQGNLLQYATCAHEEEVNIAEDIASKDIICALEIDQSTRAIKLVHYNDGYEVDSNSNIVYKEIIPYIKEKKLIATPNFSKKVKITDNTTIQTYTFSKENVFIKLHELSQQFIKIKQKSGLSHNKKDEDLKNIRQKALKLFHCFIEKLESSQDKAKYYKLAARAPIFKTHRNNSFMGMFFKTNTNNELIKLAEMHERLPMKIGINTYNGRVI